MFLLVCSLTEAVQWTTCFGSRMNCGDFEHVPQTVRRAKNDRGTYAMVGRACKRVQKLAIATHFLWRWSSFIARQVPRLAFDKRSWKLTVQLCKKAVQGEPREAEWARRSRDISLVFNSAIVPALFQRLRHSLGQSSLSKEPDNSCWPIVFISVIAICFFYSPIFAAQAVRVKSIASSVCWDTQKSIQILDTEYSIKKYPDTVFWILLYRVSG